MVTLKTLDSSIVSFIILTIILLHSYNRLESILTQYKLYITLVILNMALIVIDILGWVFNGLPGSLNYICNIGFNTILYIAAPMIPSVWVLYTCNLINSDRQKIKYTKATLLVLLSINAAITIISLFTGSYFYVDASNIYKRGPLFLVHIGYSTLLMLYSLTSVVAKRKQFQKKQYISIIMFYVAPFVGMIIQMIYYGVSFNWIGTAISLLIIYFNLQSRNLSTDYLTGVNNRFNFHIYIKEKIRSCSEKKTFGAIMIDIDNFKKINDNFGHATGDEALKDTVQILRGSLRKDDYIARLGGDEFLIVVDMQFLEMLENTIIRIKNNVEKFNTQSAKPYKLSLSFGYAIYNFQKKMKPDDFINHLDRLMYEEKSNKM